MNIIKNIIAAFLPNRCPFCNKVLEPELNYCKKCEKEFPQFAIKSFAKGGVACISPFFYQGKFKDSVKLLKFKDYTQFAKPLAIPLANSITKYADKVNYDYITYVPMHKKGLNERGYNQAQLLANEVSKILNIPCTELLIKHKENKPQHHCKGNERVSNVKGVYKVISPEKIKDKNILIIDDIITTGNTLGECCRVLYKGKAKYIYCATLCSKNNI